MMAPDYERARRKVILAVLEISPWQCVMHEVQMGLDSTGDSGTSTASLSLCESEQLEGGVLKNAYISLHVSIEKGRKQFGLTVERAVGLQKKHFHFLKALP